MIAGIPTQDAIADTWAEYSAVTQTLVAMEREAAQSAERVVVALKAHRLQRAFALMSELAEIAVQLEPPLSLVAGAGDHSAMVHQSRRQSDGGPDLHEFSGIQAVDRRMENGVDELPNKTVSIVSDHRETLPSSQAVFGVGRHEASHTMPKIRNRHLTVIDPRTGQGGAL
ncbi:hypothetical protein [Sphingomonas montana]|uniref:hypothetical protein n=1 Tax=Sphingomonas montana TaxID=1843236 RepID=UPI00101AD8C3|nr:hypothetical protein [Sphingomonas montana]